MYLPKQFASENPQDALRLMREHPLASLVSVDDTGLPFVTHLPLHVQCQGEQWVLLGHCARSNLHWRYLQERPQALVTFLGPQAYLSPSVYPDLARVPSWNYLALHCTVQARLVDDPIRKDRLLKQLIADMEPRYAEQWRALDGDFTRRMLGAIVGFELHVLQWQCKLKLNQHRPESHAAMACAYAAGDDNQRALALWMHRLGLVENSAASND